MPIKYMYFLEKLKNWDNNPSRSNDFMPLKGNTEEKFHETISQKLDELNGTIFKSLEDIRSEFSKRHFGDIPAGFELWDRMETVVKTLPLTRKFDRLPVMLYIDSGFGSYTHVMDVAHKQK